VIKAHKKEAENRRLTLYQKDAKTDTNGKYAKGGCILRLLNATPSHKLGGVKFNATFFNLFVGVKYYG